MIVTERERERGRDTGRGRSRLHAPGARCGIRSWVYQDCALGQRQVTNRCATQGSYIMYFNSLVGVPEWLSWLSNCFWLRSCPRQKAGAKSLSHPGIPRKYILNKFKIILYIQLCILLFKKTGILPEKFLLGSLGGAAVWRLPLAGRDPGDPGSNPTSGSRCMEPASPSACVSASLSLSVTIINK